MRLTWTDDIESIEQLGIWAAYRERRHISPMAVVRSRVGRESREIEMIDRSHPE